MKKLILLTDFSKTARNAANVALEIAVKMQLDILLVNSYLTPFAIFAAEGEGRSLLDSGLIASASEDGLKKEVRRLRRIVDSKSLSAQKITIEAIATLETVSQAIKSLTKTFDIQMMVIGVHETALPVIFSAVDLDQMLHQLTCPLLIVPKKFINFKVNDFVFASNLGTGDFAVLNKIWSYAKIFKFNIHICHVSAPVFVPDFIEEEMVLKFEHHVALLGQGNITFTNLKGKNLAKTLNEFSTSIGADMLAIIYNPHSISWKLFHNSHTAKLIRNQQLPLLIFPSNP
ncbi:universal stress protein [Pedobacter sp. UC225_61]|uniref:universal stress protein n=1 Tax=Pedobacter sp. UC225_61 TaxID=3374623 RepID=UPI0037928C86